MAHHKDLDFGRAKSLILDRASSALLLLKSRRHPSCSNRRQCTNFICGPTSLAAIILLRRSKLAPDWRNIGSFRTSITVSVLGELLRMGISLIASIILVGRRSGCKGLRSKALHKPFQEICLCRVRVARQKRRFLGSCPAISDGKDKY